MFSEKHPNINRETWGVCLCVCVIKALLKNIYVVQIHLNLCVYVRQQCLVFVFSTLCVCVCFPNIIHEIMINDDYDIRKWNLCNNICFCRFVVLVWYNFSSFFPSFSPRRTLCLLNQYFLFPFLSFTFDVVVRRRRHHKKHACKYFIIH